MAELPTGTVTFLFTDIEGSTQLLHRMGDSYAAVLEQHRQLLRDAFTRHNGDEVDTQGDAFFVAFARAGDAVAAAVAAQRALHGHLWPTEAPLRVRMGLHTGEPQRSASGYVGLDVHRGARVMAAGHGGQVLLSQTVQDLAGTHLPEGVTLRDSGAHRLKDLAQPEHLFQLVISGLPADFPPLKTLNNQPNNLPLQMTSFVGREREIGEVKGLLAEQRLVTLTGAGGTGKTRLSLQVAADLLEHYPDGVWQVELAPLADPALVAQAVASALGVREAAGQTLTQTLVEHLRTKTLLLLLDNCEHVLEAVSQLAHNLLREAAHLRILASSREGLNIPGETVYRLRSLALPDLAHLPPLDSLLQIEAMALFVERAVATAPSFTLTADNAPVVAQVCSRLDGIPLAIELAAARVKALAVEKLLERLDDRFRLLTGGSRTALPRQQTLRALIDWSYDLLTDNERALLRRLSVFAGGWTLEAAEAVGAGEPVEEWEVLDLLTGLVDKSLVVYEAAEQRYRLLETVRQYARDRLLESGECEAVRERHLDFCLKLAEAAKAELTGPQQVAWLNRLEQEHDNMRAALAWAQRPAHTTPSSAIAELGLRVGAALYWFWLVRGYISEGREHLSALLTGAGAAAPTAARAEALNAAGDLGREQGDYVAAHALLKEGLALFRTADDQQGVANSLGGLGKVAHNQSDDTAARALHEESLAIMRERGDKQGVANALGNLGNVVDNQGDYTAARALYEESLAIMRELGNKRGVAASLNNLGVVARHQGDYAAARALYDESLAIKREIGNKQGVANALNNLGNVAHDQGDYAAARALYDESLSIMRELGDKQGLANALGGLGNVAHDQGDYAAARALYDESLSILRELGNKQGVANSLNNLGSVAHKQGDDTAARTLYAETLTIMRELGDKHGVASALEGCAAATAALDTGQADLARAARLWGAAEVLREAIGAPLPPTDRAAQDKDVAAARAALGEAAFLAAWDTGRAMTMEQAIDYALKETADA